MNYKDFLDAQVGNLGASSGKETQRVANQLDKQINRLGRNCKRQKKSEIMLCSDSLSLEWRKSSDEDYRQSQNALIRRQDKKSKHLKKETVKL